MTARLAVRGLHVDGPSAPIVVDFNLAVAAGQIVGVVGPNGSGKTSLLDGICGLVGSRGAVLLDGRELGSLSAAERARLGIARSFQGGGEPTSLTVAELFGVAAPGSSADDLLTASGLKAFRDSPVATLSTGQRQWVDVIAATACAPLVALLDEPAAGLDEIVRASLVRHVQALASAGVAIVIVEHDASFLSRVTERIVPLLQ